MKKIVLLLLSAFLWLPVEGQDKNPFGHALVPDMIADASIQLIGDTFYCFATTDGYGRGLDTSGPPVVWKSMDFLHWSFDGICFPEATTSVSIAITTEQTKAISTSTTCITRIRIINKNDRYDG